ncbi:MAG: RiPP maturation radical SAM C-methyltransferase [Candidatus Eremiobacteraeota bacterium]|nr:RiPP maturation radical SAM C-methyltransferase [Candidatus Eremiobacteraeota bacterium]MCW5872417.1 RiPP maturation radical SAM C-methyltransferase [Candidatus Eremiobacteraeota bacterium]
MILLVNPPFASLGRPNLGLSLLKGQLRRDGHECRILYADHRLAARVGLENYAWVHRDYEALTGEWLFSGFVRASREWDFGYLEHAKRNYPPRELELLRAALQLLPEYLEEVCREILDFHPKVVGCSSTFQQNNAALAILRRLKELRPELVTIMGGANLEGSLAEPIENFPWVDYTVSGEAEGCISRLYELACEHGAHIPHQLLPAEVGCRGRRPGRGQISQMDDLAYPDFADCFEGLAAWPALSEVRPTLTLEGSRGCWWGQVKHCTFCGLNGSGMNYRAKSAARLLREIDELSQRYQTRTVEMVDNIIAPKHLKDLLPALVGRDLRFFWEVKANLKGAHFELLRAAGVHWVQPGIESFSDHVLELMRKGQRAIQNIFVLKAARENGIRLSWNLLLRHPGERTEDLVEQRDLAHSLMHLQPPQACCEVRPDRFSPLFGEIENLEPFEVYSYIYELPAEEIRKIAYLYALPPDDRPPEYHQRYQALERKVEAWKNAWKFPEKRSLHREDGRIIDRRWPGQEQIYEMSAAEIGLLEACPSPTRLLEVDAALLPRLLDLRLCYRDETHVLSLVLNKPGHQLTY